MIGPERGPSTARTGIAFFCGAKYEGIKMNENQTTLVRAAAKAKLPYNTMLNAVLRGDLIGWQDYGRHWLVDTHDLERFVRDKSESELRRDGERARRKPE